MLTNQFLHLNNGYNPLMFKKLDLKHLTIQIELIFPLYFNFYFWSILCKRSYSMSSLHFNYEDNVAKKALIHSFSCGAL